MVKQPVTIDKKQPEKPTSVTVDKNGVQLESKKVNVKIKPN